MNHCAGKVVWTPRLATALAICGVFLVTVGCGGGTPASLTGQVTFQGEPVQKGSIRMDPTGEAGGDPAAAAIVDGRYEVPRSAGLTAGQYRVSITGTEVTGKVMDPELGQEVDQVKQYIPTQYNTASELVVDLSGGENSKDFDLK